MSFRQVPNGSCKLRYNKHRNLNAAATEGVNEQCCYLKTVRGRHMMKLILSRGGLAEGADGQPIAE